MVDVVVFNICLLKSNFFGKTLKLNLPMFSRFNLLQLQGVLYTDKYYFFPFKNKYIRRHITEKCKCLVSSFIALHFPSMFFAAINYH